MNKDFKSENELGFEELEDRLEMAQVAAAESSRCFIERKYAKIPAKY